MFREMTREAKVPRPMIVTLHQYGNDIEWTTMPDNLTDEELRYIFARALTDIDDKINTEKMRAMFEPSPDVTPRDTQPSFASYFDDNAVLSTDEGVPIAVDTTEIRELEYAPLEEALPDHSSSDSASNGVPVGEESQVLARHNGHAKPTDKGKLTRGKGKNKV